MSEQRYIECKVEVNEGSYVPYYYFKMNEKVVKLSEAVNIPGFDAFAFGTKDNWIPFFHCDFGEPKYVRFRVPVEQKKAPPRCEDCKYMTREITSYLGRGIKETHLCVKTAHQTDWSLLRDTCKKERAEGKCGTDGKCFVRKERAANSGDAAKEQKGKRA